MSIQSNVKRILPKKRNAFFSLCLYLFIQSAVLPLKMRMVIYDHSEPSDRRIGNLPARLKALASRDHRKTSCSLTPASARARSEMYCFLGITTTSPSRSISFESFIVRVFIFFILTQNGKKKTERNGSRISIIKGASFIN